MKILSKITIASLTIMLSGCIPHYDLPYNPAPIWNESWLIALSQMNTRDNLIPLKGNQVLIDEVAAIYQKVRMTVAWQPPNPKVVIVQEPQIHLWPDGLLQIGEPFLVALRDEAMVAALVAHLMCHIVYGHLGAILDSMYPKTIFNIPEYGGESMRQVQCRKMIDAMSNGYPPVWEREANQGVLVVMTNIGYDPSAIGETWATLRHSSLPAIRDFARIHHLDENQAHVFWDSMKERVTEPIGGWIREEKDWKDALSGVKAGLVPLEPK